MAASCEELGSALRRYAVGHAGEGDRSGSELLAVAGATVTAGNQVGAVLFRAVPDYGEHAGAGQSEEHGERGNIAAPAPAQAAAHPGHLRQVPIASALGGIEQDLLAAARGASDVRLLPACVPDDCLVQLFEAVLANAEAVPHAWDSVMCGRIANSWRSRSRSLIWMDDKLLQVQMAAELAGCRNGDQLHLPTLGYAAYGDKEAEVALRARARGLAVAGEGLVVKPRHGANSKNVFLWEAQGDRRRTDAQLDEVEESVTRAMNAWDPSWDRECWQLSQVPRGVMLQPLYSVAVRPLNPVKARAAPLELKVQVLFGRVIGGTLNTHPGDLWVSPTGEVQLWDEEELLCYGHTRCRKIDKLYGRHLPPDVMGILTDSLRDHWQHMRRSSEAIAVGAGVDELRVDWLLGDARWGPRIGELTYMGAGSRMTPPISRRLARSYAAGHLCRLGRLAVVQVPTEAHGAERVGRVSLWPRGILDRARQGHAAGQIAGEPPNRRPPPSAPAAGAR